MAGAVLAVAATGAVMYEAPHGTLHDGLVAPVASTATLASTLAQVQVAVDRNLPLIGRR